MSKLLTALMVALLVSTSAVADGRGYQHNGRGYQHSGGSSRWVAPLIVGGLLGYAITRPSVVYAEPVNLPPAYYIEPQQVQPSYQPQPVYQQFQEYNYRCQCYVIVTRQTGWQ